MIHHLRHINTREIKVVCGVLNVRKPHASEIHSERLFPQTSAKQENSTNSVLCKEATPGERILEGGSQDGEEFEISNGHTNWINIFLGLKKKSSGGNSLHF